MTSIYQDIVGETSPEINSPSLDTTFFVVGQPGLFCPDSDFLTPLTNVKIAYATNGQDLGTYDGIDPVIRSFLDYPEGYVSPYEGVVGEEYLGKLFDFQDASSGLGSLNTIAAVDFQNFYQYCFNSSFILDPVLDAYDDKASIDALLYDEWGQEVYMSLIFFYGLMCRCV